MSITKFFDRILAGITMAYILLTIWTMNIYDTTFIPFGLAFGIWILTTSRLN
jgi:hypothetical protein